MSQVQLNWNAVSPPGSTYTVWRNGAIVATQLGTPSYLDTTVADNTAYTYMVAAVNAYGPGLTSSPASATTPPAQVTGLTATPVSSSQINLSWTATLGGTSYTVRRGGVVVGTPVGTSFSDTGLTASTLYTYTVAANGAGGQGVQSASASATTLAAAGQQIVWLPGHIARTGSGNQSGFGGQLATVLSFMDKAVAADINNQFVGFCVPAQWADLEGPTGGVYDNWGAGSGTGFTGVQQLINKCKSYNPKRYLMLSLNQAGNGSGAYTNASFPGWFCPSYLNSSTYGGGAEWAGRTGYSGYPNVNTTFYLKATALRVVALIQAYYNQFGPYDPVTGNGIYMWELTNEVSMASPCMITSANWLDAIQNGYAQLRTAAPQMMFSVRPTFINPSNAGNYGPMLAALKAAKISPGCEDGSNIVAPSANSGWKTYDWCEQAYRGAGIGAGLPNHPALGDWTFIFNVESAEYGQRSNTLAPVPPAAGGTGYIYDDPVWPGIMNGANILKASHIIWFLDGQTGPNVNRFAFPVTNGNQPANPIPGPGAGLKTARPHLVDVITGNTAYQGITGPIAIPSTARPPGY